jgi:hypothetical protein
MAYEASTKHGRGSPAPLRHAPAAPGAGAALPRRAPRSGGAGERTAVGAAYTPTPMDSRARTAFHALTPDRVLDAVEVGGLRSTGRCLPLRAFENRVYEVELEDQRRLVVKFYRPGRWTRETILDEHRFLADLAAAELPVVPPSTSARAGR